LREPFELVVYCFILLVRAFVMSGSLKLFANCGSLLACHDEQL